MPTVISVEHLSKAYRLGQIGTGTFTNDLKVWWAKMRGKPNPLLRIGETERFPSPLRPSPKIGGGDGGEGDTLWALKDVSFTVEQGEVLGIIGRNGAGKSTLLKILSRVTAPTEGKIKVKGRVASLLEVGTGFHPELTGRENIYLNGAILGMKRREIDRKFDEIVDFAEVEQFIDTPVKRYSSGMYVRLAFAVAAHLDPEILVVDEVLAVGDAEFQKKCLGKMGDVAKEGRTVLFVSHNMGAIQTLCKVAIVLSNGQSIFRGIVDEAISHYLNNGFDDKDNYIRSNVLIENRIVSIRVLNSSFVPQKTFEQGTPVLIEIRVCTRNLVKKPSIGIGVNNFNGVRIFTLSTRFQNEQLAPINGSANIYCKLSTDGLMSGNYYLKFSFGDFNEDFDTLDSVYGFEVLANDFFPSGRSPNSSQGIILRKGEWDIKVYEPKE